MRQEGQVLLNFGLSPTEFKSQAPYKPLQQAEAEHIAQTTGAVSKKGYQGYTVLLTNQAHTPCDYFGTYTRTSCADGRSNCIL